MPNCTRSESGSAAVPVRGGLHRAASVAATVIAIGSLPALGACYTYQPLAVPEPLPGTHVLAQLTRQGSEQLGSQLGRNIRDVEGQVTAADSATLRLAVANVEDYRGIRTPWNGEAVGLPQQYLAGIRQRRLSIGGTGVLGGLVVAGLVAAYELIGGRSGGKSGPGAPGGGGQ